MRRIAGVLAGAILSALIAQPSLADDNAPVKRGGFQLEALPIFQSATVHVTTDGDETYISPSEIKLGLTGKLDFKYGNGIVDRAGLFAGHCKTNIDCGSHTLLWYQQRDAFTGSRADMVKLPENDWYINQVVTTSADRLLLPLEKLYILGRCKQNPSSSFDYSFTVTLSINTRTDEVFPSNFVGQNTQVDIEDMNFNGGDQSRHADFTLRVECSTTTRTDVPKTTSNQDLSLDHGAMKVENIRLTFTTFSNGGYTEPNPGTRCKKARLRVRLETNQKGFASFKLWQRRGDQPITSKDYIVGSHHDGNGRFFAVKDLEVRVYETTLVAANAKELISETFQQETGWRDILLICESSGGTGGLVNPSDNDDRDLPKPQLTGNFQFLDKSRGAAQNKCERTAKAFIWFNNNRPDNIHYSLDCQQSGSFSGVVQPAPIGDGKYRALDIVSIPITTSINESCTLRTVAPGSPRDHATLDRTFICRGTAGHESGGGLVSTQQPTHNDPVRLGDGKPTIKTAPIRQDDSVLIGRDKRAEQEARKKRREQAAKKAQEAKRKRAADARRKAAAAERKRRANAERKKQARKKAAKRARNQAAKRARDAQRKRAKQTRRNSAGPKRKKARRTNQRRCPRGKRFTRGKCVRPAG
ncbi:MAG: hypothetical protein QM488_13415 [Rhizobiaceae bacterium]